MDAIEYRMAVSRRFGSRISAGDAVFMTEVVDITGLPHTISNGESRPLAGMNRLILMQVMKDQDWKDSRFFTSDQIAKAGCVLKSGAKPIRLEFLLGVTDDGHAAESPVPKNFHVFNASEVEGDLDNLASTSLASPAFAADVSTALARAGFVVKVEDLGHALGAWAMSLEGQRHDAPGTDTLQRLEARLATSLALVELGLPAQLEDCSPFAKQWASELDADPLLFCEAVTAAQSVAATMVLDVRSASLERLAAENMSKQRKSNQAASPRVEALYQERAAILKVPFMNKEAAKALGAVWYGPESAWFVPKGLDVKVFDQWIPKVATVSLSPGASRDVLFESFRKAMSSLGLDASGDLMDDSCWHNVSVNTKVSDVHNKSGSYILSLTGGRYGQPIGTIMNKHTGASFTWTHQGELLTPEQRARARAEAAQRESLAAEQAARIQDVAAGHAVEVWASGVSAEGHGYVLKKEISAEGLRQVSGDVLLGFSEFKSEAGLSAIRPDERYLLVPMSDRLGSLRAVQAISSDGAVKLFMRGAQKKGTMAVLGGSSFESLLDGSSGPALGFVEGVATGASFRAASGLPVVVCFDAGNLETVASNLIPSLPASMTAILGLDNDQFYLERALGFVADKVGVNPFTGSGAVGRVVSDGVSRVRDVALGDLVLDGQWHQVPGGKFCASVELGGGGIRAVSVEVSPAAGGRAVSASFSNRGLAVGEKVISLCPEAAGRVVMAVPSFRSLEGRPTDWNDLVQLEGVEAARGVLREALPLGVLPNMQDTARTRSSSQEISQNRGGFAR